MTDIIETGAIPLIYADGIDDYRIINGTVRCTAFVVESGDFPGSDPVKVAVAKLVISLAGADAAQMETQRVIREKSAPFIHVMQGKMRGH